MERTTNYDSYYYEGEDNQNPGTLGSSVYSSRFSRKHPTLPREEYVFTRIILETVNELVKESDNGKISLKILDFGIGDGRILALYEKIPDRIRSKLNKLTIIGYDVSKIGLNVLADRLSKRGYEVGKDNTEPCKGGTVSKKLRKQDVEFVLFHGDENKTIEELAKEVGSVDITISTFGSISHISGYLNRVKILEELRNITKKMVVFTIPGANEFINERKFYEKLLMEGRTEGCIKERGDIYYSPKGDNTIKNFLHLYLTDHDIKKEFQAAGYKNISVRPFSIKATSYLSNHRIRAYLDALFSYLLRFIPAKISDRLTRFHLVTAE